MIAVYGMQRLPHSNCSISRAAIRLPALVRLSSMESRACTDDTQTGSGIPLRSQIALAEAVLKVCTDSLARLVRWDRIFLLRRPGRTDGGRSRRCTRQAVAVQLRARYAPLSSHVRLNGFLAAGPYTLNVAIVKARSHLESSTPTHTTGVTPGRAECLRSCIHLFFCF